MSSAPAKLYWFPFSHHARIPYYFALAAGIPLELVVVNLLTKEHKAPEYLRLNPNGQVPTLVDGDLTMWESGSIVRYLAHKHRTDLYPVDNPKRLALVDNAYDQVRLKAWLSSLDALLELVVKPNFFKEPADAHIGQVGLKKLAVHLALLDAKFFRESPHHMVGTDFSVADIQLATLIAQLAIISYDVTPYPAIAKFWAHTKATPLFQAAHKDYYAALTSAGIKF